MVEYASYPEPSIIPQLETAAEAEALMQELAQTNEWVSVFWDRGWGDSGQPLEITIIVDGNGQMPKALIDKEIYDGLREAGLIDPNSLQTYKARKLHDFCNPDDRSRVKAADQ
jgi:hypothetical protein